MKILMLGIAPMILLVAPLWAEDHLARDSEDLQQLLTEVRKVLPSDWQAEITPDIPDRKNDADQHDPSAPGLFLWRKDDALGIYYFTANDPDMGTYKLEPMYFQLSMRPYLTRKQYEEAVARNEDWVRQRVEFENKLAEAGVRNKYAEGPPREDAYPAWAWEAKTPEQKELVRQYAILWIKTEPQELPRHFYRTLAFKSDFRAGFFLKDKQLETEWQNLRKAILKIITAYVKESDFDDKPAEDKAAEEAEIP